MDEVPDNHEESLIEQNNIEYLWLAICDLGYADECYPFYARSPVEAEQKARAWIDKQGKRILSLRTLRLCPHGFTVLRAHLPGQRHIL